VQIPEFAPKTHKSPNRSKLSTVVISRSIPSEAEEVSSNKGRLRMADQLDPDAEVPRVVAVAGVILELLGALLEEPGQLLPQRRRQQRPLHLPQPPSRQRAGGRISRSVGRRKRCVEAAENRQKEAKAVGAGAVPEPRAERVGAGVAPDVAHHRRQELLLLRILGGGGGHRRIGSIGLIGGLPTRRAGATRRICRGGRSARLPPNFKFHLISLRGPRGRVTITCSREVGPTNHHTAPPARAFPALHLCVAAVATAKAASYG